MLDQQLLIGTVFLAGLASFLSPCIFPIIPIYFGILSKGGRKVLNTFLFILGLSLTFISLGFSFGFLGKILFSNTTRVIAGIIVIILGILASVLALSGDEGSALYGAAMMFVYVLGLATPFVLFSFFSDSLLKRAKGLNKYLDKFKIAGGILIIVMGILLLTNNFA